YLFPAKPKPRVPTQTDAGTAAAGKTLDTPAGTPVPAPSPQTPTPTPTLAPGAPSGAQIAGQREERVVLETGQARAEFSNKGAQLVSYVSKQDRTVDGKPLELVRTRTGGPYPYGL